MKHSMTFLPGTSLLCSFLSTVVLLEESHSASDFTLKITKEDYLSDVHIYFSVPQLCHLTC